MRHILIIATVMLLFGLTTFAQGPDLPNTYTSSNPINEEGTGIVTFNYPEEWLVIEEAFLGIVITNDEDMLNSETISDGQIAVIVMPVPELSLFLLDLEPIAEGETLEGYAERATILMQETITDTISQDTIVININDEDAVLTTIQAEDGNVALYFIDEEHPTGFMAIALDETLEAERETVEAIISSYSVDFSAVPIGGDIARLVDASSDGPVLEAGQTQTVIVEGDDFRAMTLTLEAEEGDMVVVEVEEVGEGKLPSFTMTTQLNTLVHTVEGMRDDQERQVAFGAAAVEADGMYTLLVYPSQNEQPWAEAIEGTLDVTYWIAEPLTVDAEVEIDGGARAVFVSDTMVTVDADIELTLIPLEEDGSTDLNVPPEEADQYLVIVENSGDEAVAFSFSAAE